MIENMRYEFKLNHRAQTDLSIIMCDIDNFKRVNNEFGHEKGDKSIAQIFDNNLRKQDSLSRWGGEEFLFLLPITNTRQATTLVQKLRKNLNQLHLSMETLNLT